MRISRCDAELAQAPDVGYEDWPILLDTPTTAAEFPDGVTWEAIRGSAGAGPVYIQLEAAGDGESGRYKFEIQIGPQEVGALLRCMPVEAVPAVIGGMLCRGNSEVIGAVVGQVIAYLVERESGRAE